MANANRGKALREVVDSLPLATRQRQIALRNAETASPEEADEILRLFDELRQMMPTALAAIDQNNAAGAKQPVRRKRARKSADAKAAAKAMADRQSRDETAATKQKASGGMGRIAHSVRTLIHRRSLAVNAKSVPISGGYGKQSRISITPKRNMAILANRLIRRKELVLNDPEIDRFRDDAGDVWRVTLYVGEIRGHQIKAFIQEPVAIDDIWKGHARFGSQNRRGIQVFAFVMDDKVAYQSGETRGLKGRLDFTGYGAADVTSLTEIATT